MKIHREVSSIPTQVQQKFLIADVSTTIVMAYSNSAVVTACMPKQTTKVFTGRPTRCLKGLIEIFTPPGEWVLEFNPCNGKYVLLLEWLCESCILNILIVFTFTVMYLSTLQITYLKFTY